MKLEQCAIIRSGLLLSRKKSIIQNNTQGVHYKLLSLKSINKDGTVDKEMLEDYYATEHLAPSYITHKDDIVVRLTEPYTAVLITETLEDLLVSSHYIIIHINDFFEPGYVAWLLNTKSTLKRLKKKESGTVLSLMKRSTYAQLDIKELPSEKQKRISAYYKLICRKSEIIKELNKNETLLNEILTEMIYKG